MTDEQVELQSKSLTPSLKHGENCLRRSGKILHKVAELMRQRKDRLLKLITLEMGKLVAQAEVEVNLSADILDYYADNGEAFLADKNLNPESGEAIIKYRIGYYLVLCHGTFLFYQIVRFAAPNIMVGNTILLKHASMVPQCGIAMEELFKSASSEGLHQSDLRKKKYRFSE
jgi:succinate-semialdehyde dehydrogenase/glutarate-semialdehyde dehydrogenase